MYSLKYVEKLVLLFSNFLQCNYLDQVHYSVCNTKRNFILGQYVLAQVLISFCAVGFGKCRPEVLGQSIILRC